MILHISSAKNGIPNPDSATSVPDSSLLPTALLRQAFDFDLSRVRDSYLNRQLYRNPLLLCCAFKCYPVKTVSGLFALSPMHWFADGLQPICGAYRVAVAA
jgi:hypothetical protein